MRPEPFMVAAAGLISGATVVLMGVTAAETCASPSICTPVTDTARFAWHAAPLAIAASAAMLAVYAVLRYTWGPLALGGLVFALLAAETTLNFGARARHFDVPAAGFVLGVLAFALASAALMRTEHLGPLRAWLLGIGFGGIGLGFRYTFMGEMTSLPLVSRYPLVASIAFSFFLVGLAALLAGALLAERQAGRPEGTAPPGVAAGRLSVSAGLAVAASALVSVAVNRSRVVIDCIEGGSCTPATTEPGLDFALGFGFTGLLSLAAAVAVLVVREGDLGRHRGA